MQLKVYTDGGAIGNPGPAASAYVIYLDNKLILKHGEKIGVQTNNFAEYQAVVSALEKIKLVLKEAKYKNIQKIDFFSDSLLLVNQLNGFFKVKNARIRKFILHIRILEQDIKIPISYTHVHREKNELADRLVKKALYSQLD